MMLKFFVAILLLSSIACASKDNDPDPKKKFKGEVVRPEILQQFDLGLKYLDNENYKSALRTFRGLISKYPSSQFQVVSLYNLGASYEGLGNCKEAGITYRKVARASMNRYDRIEAQALFRLSFAYACLGYDAKAIASLLDAQRRSKNLQDEVAIAEIPARLAAAYARVGNKEKASEYFEKAKKGLQFLRTKHSRRRALKDILAKTLFLMGRMTPIEKRAFSDSLEYLKTLQVLQSYLLEAAQLDSQKWSPQAAGEITSAYENIWRLANEVEQPRTSDNEMKRKIVSTQMFEIMSEALANLKLLRSEFKRVDSKSSVMDELEFNLNERQKTFEQYLAENSVSSQLSDSALKREGLKRGGRTRGVSPLEKKARERSRLPKKGE